MFNASLNNPTKGRLIEEFVDVDTGAWYRIYDSKYGKWVEQGGFTQTGDPGPGGIPVNFLVKVKPVTILSGLIYNTTYATNGCGALNITNSSIEIDWANVNARNQTWWEVRGLKDDS